MKITDLALNIELDAEAQQAVLGGTSTDLGIPVESEPYITGGAPVPAYLPLFELPVFEMPVPPMVPGEESFDL